VNAPLFQADDGCRGAVDGGNDESCGSSSRI
jgi:hypothetical protein